MLTIRYIIRLVGAFIQRFKAIMLIALIIGIAFFFILRTLFFNNSIGKEVIGVTGRYTINTLPDKIINKISRGLTSLDIDGSAVPSVGLSWDTPDKGKTWIFKIDTTLKWQDGKQLKSSDVSYGFSDVTESYPDDQTIEFRLQNGYSAFPVIVDKPIFKKGLLGLSEWQVKKLKLSGSYVESIILINSQKELIEYKFFPTEERTKLAFKLGVISRIEDLTSLSPFENWKNIEIIENLKTNEYVGIFFNNQDNILGEKTIRQALTYAIDKSRYTESRAISPVSINSWAYNSQVKRYETDKKKAKEVIDQFKKDSKKDEIIITLSVYPSLLSEAEKIAVDWREIGLKVNITSISGNTSDYQALLAIFDTPDDPDQYSIWHSTQTGTNLTHYQNPRIDKLLEDGRSEIDINLRKKIYLDFQRFLVEDAPVAFLYYPKTYTISKK